MPAYPVDNFAIRGFFREAAVKPAGAANASCAVIELRAQRIGREGNEGYGGKVEITPARKEGPCKKERFAFDQYTGEYQ